ncbi:MAG: hypothetical protein K2Q19_10250 [Rhodocyclaceae bacterium]|nr:hypothetical protein [Rhodocyclaceae bacterium]
MGKNVIYAVLRLNDDDGHEIHHHNLGHMRPTMGVLTVFDGTVAVRKRHTRRTRCARLTPPGGGATIEGFEMHDVVIETHDCGRVMVYGKQRIEVGSRVKITGQAWWCEMEDFIKTED